MAFRSSSDGTAYCESSTFSRLPINEDRGMESKERFGEEELITDRHVHTIGSVGGKKI